MPLGAILTQQTIEEEQAVAYALRSLRGAELNYLTSEKECLAVVWEVEKWRRYPEGSPSALAWSVIVSRPPPIWPDGPQGCSSSTSPCITEKAISIRDQMLCSRRTTHRLWGQPHTSPSLPQNLPQKYQTLTTLTLGNKKKKNGWQPQKDQKQRISFKEHHRVLYRRVPLANLGKKYQMVVPQSLISELGFLHYYHDNPLGGHKGRLKTLLRGLKVAWWPSVHKDVWQYVWGCEICQKYKADNQKTPGADAGHKGYRARPHLGIRPNRTFSTQQEMKCLPFGNHRLLHQNHNNP